jgi:hypothetical protein
MIRLSCPIAGIFAMVLLVSGVLSAQAPADNDAIGRALKPILIDAMPAILYEKSDNWGHQAMVPVGLKWQGVKPSVQQSPRNHGTWKKLVINSQDLKRSLDLKIYDLKSIDSEKQTFKVHFAFQMGVRYDQQNWENGLRLWSGSLQARAQVKLDMDCENTLKVEVDKNFLPDFIIRLRVTRADIRYDNLVVEHINGIGGSGAKLLGQAVHDCMNQWKPSIERDLLAKANSAIVKAADTREIRLGFGSLLKKK